MAKKKNIFKTMYYHSYKIWTPFRVIRNLVLTWRYPWLTAHNWRTGGRYYDSIWATPRDGGWNRAFFWQMMEDIRKAAKKDGVLKDIKTDDYKSKYGGLRFYISGGTHDVDEIIHEYEYLSEAICEYCGEPDVGYTKGWITPICRKCYERCYNDTRSYEECVGEGRMPDYYRYRKASPDKDWEEFSIDIRDKANKIRRRWNRWHPTRRKEYAKY